MAKSKPTKKLSYVKQAAAPTEAQPAETVVDDKDSKTPESLKALEKRARQGEFQPLLDQIESEYSYAWLAMQPKWTEWGVRLKLYNNQKRDKEAVGDPLLFTIMQTVLASLYNDQLSIEWAPRESGDEDVVEGLNALALHDNEDMEKDIVDYLWDWDTLFFGTGLIEFCEFDRTLKVPIPENIDPMTFLRDPKAKSINGDRRGRGRARFCGRELRLTKHEMETAGVYFNLSELKADTGEMKSLLDQNAELRASAQGYNVAGRMTEGLKGDNATYHLLAWYTRYKGKLCRVVTGNGRKTLVRMEELEENYIPIFERRLFPIAHDFDGVSIPDLVEDKQRARAVATNAALKGIKSNLNPVYLYDKNKIKNKADLNFTFNKQIGIDGNPNNVVTPMNRDSVKQEVSWIMNLLDSSAQRATATPEQQQGVNSTERMTATESNILDRKVDVRYSLAGKIFGWSEKRFWKQWYQLYKKYFKAEIDEKIMRLSGSLGVKFRPLRRENIVAKTDPDAIVQSKAIRDVERFNELQLFKGFLTIIAQDPSANIRYAEKKFGKLSGIQKDELERLLPLTIEEMVAEEENALIEKDELVEVRADDDHEVHLQIHNKASDTPAKAAHIQAHKKAMVLRKMHPELFPATPSGLNPTQGEGVETGDTMNMARDRRVVTE